MCVKWARHGTQAIGSLLCVCVREYRLERTFPSGVTSVSDSGFDDWLTDPEACDVRGRHLKVNTSHSPLTLLDPDVARGERSSLKSWLPWTGDRKRVLGVPPRRRGSEEPHWTDCS